jgi:ribosomal protein S27AE
VADLPQAEIDLGGGAIVLEPAHLSETEKRRFCYPICYPETTLHAKNDRFYCGFSHQVT